MKNNHEETKSTKVFSDLSSFPSFPSFLRGCFSEESFTSSMNSPRNNENPGCARVLDSAGELIGKLPNVFQVLLFGVIVLSQILKEIKH
jgi:hypothetical protein